MSQALSLNASLGGIGAGLGVVGLIAFVKSATDTATELKNIAAQSGATVEEIQELNFAFTQNGATMKDATSSQRRFARRMVDMESAFNKQGISVRDADGKLRKYKDVLMDTADVIKGTESESAKAAIAFQLFGDSGFKLVQALDGGSEGLKELADEARESGQVIGGEANDAIVSFSDELAKLGGTAKNVAAQALGEVFLAIGRVSRAAGNFSVTGSIGDAIDAGMKPAEIAADSSQNDSPHVQMGNVKDTLESILALEQKRAALHITEQEHLTRVSKESSEMGAKVEGRIQFETGLLKQRLELEKKGILDRVEGSDAELAMNSAQLQLSRAAHKDEVTRMFLMKDRGDDITLQARKVRGIEKDIAERQEAQLKIQKQRNALLVTNKELLLRLADEEQIRKDANNLLENDAEFQDRKVKALKLQFDLEESILKTAQQKAALESSLAGQTASLATTKEDRSKFGLEELANSNPYGFGTAEFNADVLKAREVVRLESIAESARFDYGNSARASGFLNQADEIRNGISSLRSNERNPFASLEDGIRATEEAIKDLPGMVVVPKVGP